MIISNRHVFTTSTISTSDNDEPLSVNPVRLLRQLLLPNDVVLLELGVAKNVGLFSPAIITKHFSCISHNSSRLLLLLL
ncbi:hypothetical protein Hanom_Chr10g00954241 [Helianthus anomalus]